MAAMHGHLSTVQLLLKDGRADPTAWSNYALGMAKFYKYNDVVECLQQDDRVNPLLAQQRIVDRCHVIKEDLMKVCWHPRRVENLLLAGYDIDDM